MSTLDDLRKIFEAARPLLEQSLDIADQLVELREAATKKGLDWSQIKSLLKAHIEDDRDESGSGRRIKKIVERAEFACAYADMLGLPGKMNEKNFSRAPAPRANSADDLDIPDCLRRTPA